MKYKLIINKESEEEIVVTVRSPSPLTERIEDLIRNYNGSDSIIGYREGDIYKLLFTQIECITVSNRKTIAVDNNGKEYVIKDSLRVLEETLPSYFIRINKSSIANKNCIKQFKVVFSGAVNAEFECGFTEYVSRRCFSEIKRRLLGK